MLTPSITACNDRTGKVLTYQQVISSYTHTQPPPLQHRCTCLHTRTRNSSHQVTLRDFHPDTGLGPAWLSTPPAFAPGFLAWDSSPLLHTPPHMNNSYLLFQSPLPGSIWEHSQEARKHSQTSQVPLLPAAAHLLVVQTSSGSSLCPSTTKSGAQGLFRRRVTGPQSPEED